MKIIYFLVLTVLPSCIFAQHYHAKDGLISFASEAPSELISSSTKKTYSTLHTGNGKITCTVPINSFAFKKTGMHKHFNENYLESFKYRNATFKGYLKDMQAVNFLVPGQYATTIFGELSIHGISREIIVEAEVFVEAKSIRIKVNFDVLLRDFGITIPDFVKDNLGEKVRVEVDVIFVGVI